MKHLLTCLTILCLALPAAAQELIKPDGSKVKIDDAMKDKIKVAAPKMKISPEAQKLVDQIKKAYGELKGLQVEGAIKLDFDAAGQVRQEQATLTGSLAGAGKFRSELQGDTLIVSDGKTVYTYRTAKNDYRQADAPKGRVAMAKLPADMREVLAQQNPSLLMAIVTDPTAVLTNAATELTTAADETIDGQACKVLVAIGKNARTSLALDARTGLLRRISVDIAKSLEDRGMSDVKKATVVVDYTKTTPQAATDEKLFAWTPPQGAKVAAAGRGATGDDGAKPSELVGKDAPDFSLEGMDGKQVAMADLRGSVVVLDFWATWCGPCRAALPGLNKIYEELSPRGLKVFAVNLEENKQKITPVVTQLKLTIPVLLDTDSAVSKSYLVQGIPQTVVIGADGKVKKVFVGSGNDENIRAAVEAEIKGAVKAD